MEKIVKMNQRVNDEKASVVALKKEKENQSLKEEESLSNIQKIRDKIEKLNKKLTELINSKKIIKNEKIRAIIVAALMLAIAVIVTLMIASTSLITTPSGALLIAAFYALSPAFSILNYLMNTSEVRKQNKNINLDSEIESLNDDKKSLEESLTKELENCEAIEANISQVDDSIESHQKIIDLLAPPLNELKEALYQYVLLLPNSKEILNETLENQDKSQEETLKELLDQTYEELGRGRTLEKPE